MGYCTLDDVFNLALSAQAFITRPRPFDAVDISTATIRLKAHGLSLSDVITFEASSSGSLPTGISGFQPYYPIPVSGDLVRVALTPSGTPIASWVASGSGWGIVVDFTRRLQAHIDATAAEIDENLTADEPPLTAPFPTQIIALNARMAARAAVLSLQIDNAQYRVAVDRLMAKETADMAQLAIWRSGKPLNPRPTDQSAQLDNATLASGATGTNWRMGTL